jgi:ribosome-associated protein
MNSQQILNEITNNAQQSFSRSSGPGGQNVNKVNTKVTLFIPLDQLSLSDREKIDLRESLHGRINARGEIVITCDSARSQQLNRQTAISKAFNIIIAGLKKKKKRVPSQPTKASITRRLVKKNQHSQTKSLRRSPITD